MSSYEFLWHCWGLAVGFYFGIHFKRPYLVEIKVFDEKGRLLKGEAASVEAASDE